MPKEYIDKEALLLDLSETIIFSGKPDTTSAEIRGANKVISRIKAAPMVDVVEVVHGERIITKKRAPNGRKILYEIKTCSVCGKTHGRHKPNYCPNCGAKMDGERKITR